MLAAGLITFREGLEAALIIGIVLGYLVKIGQQRQTMYAWAGVIAAAVVSIGIAMLLQFIGSSLEEPYEQIFEGTMMLLAVGVLTWMIFWMQYQGRFIKRDLENQVKNTLAQGATLGIFGLTFLAVVREGIETALFLSASAFASDAAATWLGSLVGLVLAAAAGYAVYTMSLRLNLKMFFNVTSILLLIFAAGLFAHAVHEFQEIGWLPFMTQEAWNLQNILPNTSLLGSILRTMVGYNDAPTMLEVVAYFLYWAVVLIGVRWWTRRLNTRLAPTQAQA